MKRKGFSYLEIFYVMLIGSSILALSIPAFYDSQSQDRIISVKENVYLAIKQQQTYFLKETDYENVDRIQAGSDNSVAGDDYLKFYADSGTFFETRPVNCIGGLIGFYIKIEDPKITNPLSKFENYVEYNSCTDTTILRPEK